ncbi:MAG TPA: hypothetical protein VMJ10_17395, partial [Kofleriaceae bacterium]|nr:hypothetical protein [Kofleriaceae bacterium]
DLHAHRIVELPPASDGWAAADGKHAVTMADRTATAWNLVDKTVLHRVELAARPTVAAWSPHGDAIAFGTGTGDVIVWSIAGEAAPTAIYHHRGGVTSISWGAGGLVVSGDDQGGVHVWAASRAATVTAYSLGGPVDFVAFSRDGARFGVAAGSQIEVRDAATLGVLAHLAHEANVLSFDFDDRGERLVSGAEDSIGRVWRVADGALVARLSGASAGVYSPQFVGGSLAVATGGDGVLRFWDIDRAKEIVVLPGATSVGSAVLHDPAGDFLVISVTGEIVTWRLPTL